MQPIQKKPQATTTTATMVKSCSCCREILRTIEVNDDEWVAEIGPGTTPVIRSNRCLLIDRNSAYLDKAQSIITKSQPNSQVVAINKDVFSSKQGDVFDQYKGHVKVIAIRYFSWATDGLVDDEAFEGQVKRVVAVLSLCNDLLQVGGHISAHPVSNIHNAIARGFGYQVETRHDGVKYIKTQDGKPGTDDTKACQKTLDEIRLTLFAKKIERLQFIASTIKSRLDSSC